MRVLPADVELEVSEDDDLFWAARAKGWTWPTVCDGNCECGQCFVTVEAGAENLSPMEDAERQRLAESPWGSRPGVRLACCVFVNGPATVRRKGAHPTAG